MLPLGTVATIEDVGGPTMITRYNMRTAAALNGAALPGVSSGTVISRIGGLAKAELPKSMTYEWTELTYLQLQEGYAAYYRLCRRGGAGLSGAGGPVRELFVAAGDHPRRADVPARLAGRRVRSSSRTSTSSCRSASSCWWAWRRKNAILIVVFAKANQDAGKSRFDATVAACRSRLRPIIMTSFAFILGVVPLMIAHGAGAEMRRAPGNGGLCRHAGRDPVRHLSDAGLLLRRAVVRAIRPTADDAGSAGQFRASRRDDHR